MTDELQLPPGLQIRLLTSEESALLAGSLSSEDTRDNAELSDGQVKDNPVSLEFSNSLPPKSSFPASLCSILKFLTPSPYILSVLQTSQFPLSFLLLTTPCASRKMKRMTDKDKLQEEGRRSRSRERGGGTYKPRLLQQVGQETTLQDRMGTRLGAPVATGSHERDYYVWVA